MPANEIAIGKRLKEVREKMLINKTAVAIKLGMSRELLFNYETGRTPLPWDIGSKICENLNISQVWLATGDGSWDHYLTLRLVNEPLPRMKFSEAYEQYFLPALVKARADISQELPGKDSESVKLRKAISLFGRPSGLRFTPAEFPRLVSCFAQILEILDAAKKRKVDG